MLSSSIQATLEGRYAGSEVRQKQKSGRAVHELRTKNRCTGLELPYHNLFGKWCRPNYNSVVTTFCNNIANDLPIRVDDASTELELLYIDDLVDELIATLTGGGHRCEYHGTKPVPKSNGSYYYVPTTHHVTLGEITELLESFGQQPKSLIIPEIANNSFAKKLYSTYLSYLPKEKVAFPLKMNVDDRGSFTELLKSEKCGQVSVNISKPGIKKGEHWHSLEVGVFYRGVRECPNSRTKYDNRRDNRVQG